MTDPHIEYLDIENFKCFQKLEMKNIQRVNLIGGKNNVGKTALLEAVELLTSAVEPLDLNVSLKSIMRRRQEGTGLRIMEMDFFFDEDKRVIISSNNTVCQFYLLEEGELDAALKSNDSYELSSSSSLIDFHVNGKDKRSSVNELIDGNIFFARKRIKTLINLVLFIEASKNNEASIAILYGSLIDLGIESFLNESLSIFDPNILSLKQKVTESGVVLKIQLKNTKYPVLLSSMGEGVSRYIAILCAIWASKDGVLLIDEIENGIHYSNYPKLWKIIFQVSKDANCQVFVTSHSKECIEAFNEAQRDYGDGMYFELYKNLKTGMIDISGRETEQLEYALTHGGKIRGE